MPDEAPHFDNAGRLVSPRFDDVYFSAEDGLAETRHVFLEGNRLAERFAAMRPGECFTIGETGFGTGLNFLAAWQAFEQHAPAKARLEFVSVEGFPLDAELIQQALSPWPGLERYAEALLTQWGPLWPGLHRFRFARGRVRLTLLAGEAAEALSSIDATIDAWFLDGFAPSRNPAMWSDALFRDIARLSAPDASLATYTAAGFVRRGLASVGFDVEKRPGFGSKRDMTVGRYHQPATGLQASESNRHQPDREGHTAIVIGGSLAGAFAARSLAERGLAVSVLESQASISNSQFPPSLIPRRSVLQPKINDQTDPAGRFLRDGYAYVSRLLSSEPGLQEACGWSACGSFQAAHDGRARRRLSRFVEQFGDTGLCRWIEASQTEAETGLALPCDGVVIDRAGVLSPAGLCSELLDHPRIELISQTNAAQLEQTDDHWRVHCSNGSCDKAGTVLVANGIGAPRLLEPWAKLDLHPVRGQVTLLGAPANAGRLAGLRRALFYGGYLTPGGHSLGASFISGDRSLGWRDAEHADCCDKLARILPDEADRLKRLSKPEGWVGIRSTSPTHRCYAEQVAGGLFVSLGHGSHGIASAAHAGEHLACLITSGPRRRGG